MKIAQLILVAFTILIGLSLVANSFVTYAEPVDANAMQNGYITSITSHVILLVLVQIIHFVLILRTGKFVN